MYRTILKLIYFFQVKMFLSFCSTFAKQVCKLDNQSGIATCFLLPGSRRVSVAYLQLALRCAVNIATQRWKQGSDVFLTSFLSGSIQMRRDWRDCPSSWTGMYAVFSDGFDRGAIRKSPARLESSAKACKKRFPFFVFSRLNASFFETIPCFEWLWCTQSQDMRSKWTNKCSTVLQNNWSEPKLKNFNYFSFRFGVQPCFLHPT